MNNRHLMVVDDEVLMRSLLQDFLTSQGYQVHCFATANAALKTLRDGKKPFSAVIADIRMVPVNGMELLKRVKIDFPTLPVLLFTSAGTPEEREMALRSGAFHYFTKPFPLSDLRQIVDLALAAKLKKAD